MKRASKLLLPKLLSIEAPFFYCDDAELRPVARHHRRVIIRSAADMMLPKGVRDVMFWKHKLVGSKHLLQYPPGS